jgi:hypothetical protein
LRFSLRTLLVFVLVISVPLGWLAFKMGQAKKQRVAVQRIKELGDLAVQCPNYEPQRWTPRVPSWLRNILGEDFFVTINYVSLQGPNVTDAELERCELLPRLRVYLKQSSPMPDSFTSNRRLSQTLTAEGIKITDRGLAMFAGCPSSEAKS